MLPLVDLQLIINSKFLAKPNNSLRLRTLEVMYCESHVDVIGGKDDCIDLLA